MNMSTTIPRERTATAGELADEAARAERARTGQPLPRTLHALCEQAARLVNCGHCWARPGTPCEAPDGYHLARVARATRRGLMTVAEFATVTAPLDVFTDGTLIRDGDR
jgi:hypothetical protein